MQRLDSMYTRLVVAGIALLLVVGMAICHAGDRLPWYGDILMHCGRLMLLGGVIITALSLVVWLLYHRVYRGLKYAYLHYSLSRNLKTELYDAGVYVKRYCMGREVAVLPRIRISFANKYLTGEVQIEASIKDRAKLEDKDISCALGRYVVEQSYISADGNWFIYDIFDSRYDRQIVYPTCEMYASDCTEVGSYDLQIDAVTTVGLHHSLICGQTGTGKSYACYVLAYQMLCKKVHYNLYFADPKRSGLAVLGNRIDASRTADTIDGIIALIRQLHNELEKRQIELEKALKTSKRIDADYRSFGMEPYVFIFDEYLAFSLSLATYKKEIRDEMTQMMSDIVLMGRQCGFFLWLLMQSAPSTQIPTFIRDQLVFKVVLGNSDKSTYMVTFDRSADIPTGRFVNGYGVYTYAGKTEKPQIIAFPTIRDFDILQAIDAL